MYDTVNKQNLVTVIIKRVQTQDNKMCFLQHNYKEKQSENISIQNCKLNLKNKI